MKETPSGASLAFNPKAFSTAWARLCRAFFQRFFACPLPSFSDRFSPAPCPIMKPGRKGERLVTVVYIDSVFALNALMDYLLLLAAARLAGLPLRRRRYLLAALAGGGYAVACFLPGLGFLAAAPAKLAAGVLLGLIAYGGEERLLRLILLFFAVSCAMAGCVLGLGLLTGNGAPVVGGVFYTNVSLRVLATAAAAVYAVLTVIFRAAARQGLRGVRLPVRVRACGGTAELTALWDSGNTLREPGGGRAVLVLSPGSLDSLLPWELRALLAPERLAAPETLLEPVRALAPELRPRLLPYRAVGTAGGLLLAVRTEWTEINGTRYLGLTAALSPTALGAGALWGGEPGKEDRDEHLEGTAKDAAPAGVAAGERNPLHRGQRHPAAAPEPGAGGGAPCPHGRGGPAGAD